MKLSSQVSGLEEVESVDSPVGEGFASDSRCNRPVLAPCLEGGSWGQAPHNLGGGEHHDTLPFLWSSSLAGHTTTGCCAQSKKIAHRVKLSGQTKQLAS